MNREIIEAVEALAPRSSWDKGVKAGALDLLDYLDDREVTTSNLLNGARDWLEYSEGGCGLIWDYEIAERYCTPSELKLTKGGERQPNPSETWIELQARALHQAHRLIMENKGNRSNENDR